MLSTDFVVMLSRLRLEDKESVGFDLASLGELAQHNIQIQDAIVIAPFAFEEFKKQNNLSLQIKHLLGTINPDRHDSLVQVESYIKKIITHAQVPRSIFEPLFAVYEKKEYEKVSVEAYYLNDNKVVARKMWVGIEGESVLVEAVRNSWAHLFEVDSIIRHNIHHDNHHAFSVVVAIRPSLTYEQAGTVMALKEHGKSEFKIKSHSDEENLLTAKEVEQLIEYARVGKKVFYHNFVTHWAKRKGQLLVTAVQPELVSDVSKNEYSDFLGGVAVHPGITMGRLKIVAPDQKIVDVGVDEIIYLEKVDLSLLRTLRRAKGIIVKDRLDPELHFMLRNMGIPSVAQAKSMKDTYAHGDIITLNAKTGEVRRGSILI